MNFANIQDAVRIYTANGLRCMPLYGPQEGCKHKGFICSSGSCIGKVPIVDNWPDHKPFMPKDFEYGNNLALIMGKQLDGRWLVGLDVDGPLNLAHHFRLPETLECLTKRGRHLIFQVPEDTPLGNWMNVLDTINKKIGYRDGVQGALDIKYCRGAMVSPPSRTKTGLEYSWIRFRKPAWLPFEVIQYLIKQRKKNFPDVKRYYRWSKYPSHFGKKP